MLDWLFKSKKRRDDEVQKVAEVKQKEKDADAKVNIAILETEKVNKLIERAKREGNRTLELTLTLGGDRRMH